MPHCSAELPMSMGTNRSVRRGGGGGTCSSRQSGSRGTSCAKAVEANDAAISATTLRRMLVLGTVLQRRVGLRVGLECRAGRQLEPRCRHVLGRVIVFVLARAHAAAKVA